MRIFFRKLFGLYVPVCRFECDKAGYESYCQANSNGFTCTRTKGHKGAHSACGSTGGDATEIHDLFTWED